MENHRLMEVNGGHRVELSVGPDAVRFNVTDPSTVNMNSYCICRFLLVPQSGIEETQTLLFLYGQKTVKTRFVYFLVYKLS